MLRLRRIVCLPLLSLWDEPTTSQSRRSLRWLRTDAVGGHMGTGEATDGAEFTSRWVREDNMPNHVWNSFPLALGLIVWSIYFILLISLSWSVFSCLILKSLSLFPCTSCPCDCLPCPWLFPPVWLQAPPSLGPPVSRSPVPNHLHLYLNPVGRIPQCWFVLFSLGPLLSPLSSLLSPLSGYDSRPDIHAVTHAVDFYLLRRIQDSPFLHINANSLARLW